MFLVLRSLDYRKTILTGIMLMGLVLSNAETYGQANHMINWQLPAIDADLTIVVDDTVTWVWNDALPHTVTSVSPLFDSGTLTGSGMTFFYVFTSTGAVDYFCEIHGAQQMNGTITVNEALPVELTSFNAVLDASDVLLSWTTASESDNAGFIVQIQRESEVWNEVAFVEGAGNSLSERKYTYRVSGLAPGAYRVRLKQLDFDGSASFSGAIEVSIEVPGSHTVSAAYPNPVHEGSSFTTHIRVAVAAAQVVEIEAYGSDGRLVEDVFRGTLESNSSREIAIDASKWPNGFYILRIAGERFEGSRMVSVVR